VVEAWEALGDRRMQAWTLAMLGYVNAASLDRYVDAHKHFEQGLALARESGDEVARAALLNNLGSSHRTLGRFEEAQRSLEQALALYRAANRRGNEGRVLNGLGYLFRVFVESCG